MSRIIVISLLYNYNHCYILLNIPRCINFYRTVDRFEFKDLV